MSLITRNEGRRRISLRRPAPAERPERAAAPAEPCTPIGTVAWRDSVRIQGRVRSVRVQPWADVASLQCVLVDETGGLTVVFFGRRKMAGVYPGTVMAVEGVVGAHNGKLALLNPAYELIESPHFEAPHH